MLKIYNRCYNETENEILCEGLKLILESAENETRDTYTLRCDLESAIDYLKSCPCN